MEESHIIVMSNANASVFKFFFNNIILKKEPKNRWNNKVNKYSNKSADKILIALPAIPTQLL